VFAQYSLPLLASLCIGSRDGKRIDRSIDRSHVGHVAVAGIHHRRDRNGIEPTPRIHLVVVLGFGSKILVGGGGTTRFGFAAAAAAVGGGLEGGVIIRVLHLLGHLFRRGSLVKEGILVARLVGFVVRIRRPVSTKPFVPGLGFHGEANDSVAGMAAARGRRRCHRRHVLDAAAAARSWFPVGCGVGQRTTRCCLGLGAATDVLQRALESCRGPHGNAVVRNGALLFCVCS